MNKYRVVCAAKRGTGGWGVEYSPDGVVFDLVIDGYSSEAEALRHLLIIARIERDNARQAAVPANDAARVESSYLAARRMATSKHQTEQTLLILRR